MEPFCFIPSSVLNQYDRKVLMTGFLPFTGIKTNPSWEAVKQMNQDTIQEKHNVLVVKKEVPVIYQAVDKKVPTWIMNLQPYLTIHVGVSPKVSCFVLETQAHKKGYEREDDEHLRPLYLEVPSKNEQSESPDTLVTQLDVAVICRQFNRNFKNLEAKISSDAGRFLCEYIYYTSLCHSRSPTLFVHIPLSKYKTIHLAQGLECILDLCLNQLKKDNEDYYSYTVE